MKRIAQAMPVLAARCPERQRTRSAQATKEATLEEAKAIKNVEIVDALELPPIKIHCSVLAEDSIRQAIEDYEAKQ